MFSNQQSVHVKAIERLTVFKAFISRDDRSIFYKFLQKRCSKKFHKIHMKTPVPKSFFNKVADLHVSEAMHGSNFD